MENFVYLYDGTKLRAVNGVGGGFDYLGSLVYNRNGANSTLESAAFGAGRIIKTSTGYDVRYFLTDHLGSVRASVNQHGQVSDRSDYQLLGERWAGQGIGATTNRYQFNGKESQTLLASASSSDGISSFLDYGARHYNSRTGRWSTIDRFAEKYGSFSPYSYAANNPINYMDANGDSVVLSGSQRDAALSQVQTRMGKELNVSMSKNGTIVASPIGGVEQSRASTMAMAAFSSTDVTVNIIAENSTTTSTGRLYAGGAFMGNTVNQDGSVTANQEVNPQVLGAMSEAYRSPGQDMMHEVTEAYQGGLLSKQKGVSSPASGIAGTVFQEAHSAAMSQSGALFMNTYNSSGGAVKKSDPAVVRAEWVVYPKGQSPRVIMKYP